MGKLSGTRQWSQASANCYIGCFHNCRYCYARYNAEERFRTIEPGTWSQMQLIPEALTRRWPKKRGVVMFPTSHDITPGTLGSCIRVLLNILAAGNRVLIVSKPHLVCIRELSRVLKPYQDKVMFRFTISSTDDSLLSYWEPEAPRFSERLACLERAFLDGYRTSVSMEPMLYVSGAPMVLLRVDRWVTDTIWIGLMNQAERRVKAETMQDQMELDEVIRSQRPEAIRALYRMVDNPKVRWKESVCHILGLQPMADQWE